MTDEQSTLEEIRARSKRRETLPIPPGAAPLRDYAVRLEADRDALLRIADRLRFALLPLVRIADAYDANELDDEARKFWGKNGEQQNSSKPENVELYSGRGGRRLLTLADAFVARGALASEPPDQGTDSPRAVSLDAAAAIARDFVPPSEYDDPCNCQRSNSWHERGSYVCLNEPKSVEKADVAPPAKPSPTFASVRSVISDIIDEARCKEGRIASPGEIAAALEERFEFGTSSNRSLAIAEMAEGLERISARAAKLEAVYAALRTWPIFADGKEIDPEIVAREGLDKAAAEEALAALDAALRAFPELSDPDEPVEPDDVRRVATRHAAMIREGLAVPERPILVNETDPVTTALLGIGKAWSAYRAGSVLGDSIGWGATREAAEADLRAKEELI